MTDRYAIWRPRAERAMPVVIHVPHASSSIPMGDRADFALDDHDLRLVAEGAAASGTERLASLALAHGGHVFVNRVSALVVDPVGPPDGDGGEPDPWGSRAVPSHAHDGAALRRPGWSARDRMRIVRSHYFPYHGALAGLLGELEGRFGDPVGLISLRCIDGDDGGAERIRLGYDEAYAPEPWLGWWRRRKSLAVDCSNRSGGAFVPAGMESRERVCAMTLGIDRTWLKVHEPVAMGVLDLFFSFACNRGQMEATC
jgi:hypothetical protein